MEAVPKPAEAGPLEPGNHAANGGEFIMTAEDLRAISELGQGLIGIELGTSKRQMVYSRLSRRLRALGFDRFSSYVNFLNSPEGVEEYVHFANALTTNLTAFFREAHHFDHFEREIRRPVADRNRRLRIWSAGCSTGEEPYSIAMILHANAELLGGRDRRVLATDVDTQVLETAAKGIYANDRLRGLPGRFRTAAYLNAEQDRSTIAEPIQHLVTFRALNLIGPWPFKGPFDVIFCRNVLIYFSASTRDRIVDQFTSLLRPGGVLYLGHSESISASQTKLIAEGHTIYRRINA